MENEVPKELQPSGDIRLVDIIEIEDNEVGTKQGSMNQPKQIKYTVYNHVWN